MKGRHDETRQQLAGCGADDEPTATDLLGTWSNDGNGADTSEIGDGSITVTGGVIDGFTYTATDSSLELTDDPGPMACTQLGTYEWEIEADVSSLTVLSDGCNGRRNALDGATYVRAE